MNSDYKAINTVKRVYALAYTLFLKRFRIYYLSVY